MSYSVNALNRPSVSVLPTLWRNTCPGLKFSRKLPFCFLITAMDESPRVPPTDANGAVPCQRTADDRDNRQQTRRQQTTDGPLRDGSALCCLRVRCLLSLFASATSPGNARRATPSAPYRP